MQEVTKFTFSSPFFAHCLFFEFEVHTMQNTVPSLDFLKRMFFLNVNKSRENNKTNSVLLSILHESDFLTLSVALSSSPLGPTEDLNK